MASVQSPHITKNASECNISPLVSVIIPVYNVEKYVGECIDGVLSQDYDNLDIIVVDDCSPDKSIAIVKEKFENYNGPKHTRIICHEQNRGLAAARNTGIKYANGELLYFLDSDDLLARNDALSLLVKRKLETNADIVAGNNISFDDATLKQIKTIGHKYSRCYRDNQDYNPIMSIQGVAWNFLIERNLIVSNDVYFDNGIIFEDSVWVFKLNCIGYTFAAIPEITYKYRMRSQSLLNTLTEKHIISQFRIPAIANDYISKHKVRNQDYALMAISDFRHGALMRCATKVKNQEIYRILYTRLQQRCPDLRIGKVIKSKANLLKKVRTLIECMPYVLTGKLSKAIIKHQYRNFNCTDGTKKYPPLYIHPDNILF